MNNRYSTTLAALLLTILAGCGGSGGSNLAGAATSLTSPPICPNGTIKTPTNQSPSNLLCDAPKLVSISPANNANDISVDAFTGVVVTTDSPLDITSINVDNIKLSASGVNVLGVVTTVGTNGLRFTPNTKLIYAQQYTFTASVKDILGKTFLVTINFSTSPILCTSSQYPISTGKRCVAPVFATSPTLLPDVRKKYDRLCGDAVGMRAFTANISGHKDGKKDIVATFACGINPVGQTLLSSVPTKNGLVVFLQRNDGTFYDGTLDIFGVDLVDLGGISFERPAVFDINNDGYDEIVLPITGEDGRVLLANDTTTWNNKQVVFITSIGNGKYKVEKLGWASYGMAADLVDNQFNSKDVITTVIGYGGKPQAWRLNGANWNLTTDYDSLGNSLTGLYFPSTIPSTGSVSHLAATSATSLALYKKSNYIWSKSADWSFQNTKQAQFIAWNGQQGTLNLINYNGADYGFVSFGDYCALRRSADESYFGFYQLPSSLITGGYRGQLLRESSTDFQDHILLMGFSIVNGNITQIIIPFQNEISNQKPLKMTCNDVNGSGNQAITILTWGQNAKPIVYLNNNNGGYSSINQNVFPSASNSFDGNTSILEDIDGDGIPDLFVYPLNGLRNSPATVQYQIFKGNRVLGVIDLN